MRNKIVSIDFQKDFTAEGGACYRPRSSVAFVKDVLVPHLEEHDRKKTSGIFFYFAQFSRLPREGFERSR